MNLILSIYLQPAVTSIGSGKETYLKDRDSAFFK